jgi:hypothetical protein
MEQTQQMDEVSQLFGGVLQSADVKVAQLGEIMKGMTFQAKEVIGEDVKRFMLDDREAAKIAQPITQEEKEQIYQQFFEACDALDRLSAEDKLTRARQTDIAATPRATLLAMHSVMKAGPFQNLMTTMLTSGAW